MPILALLLAGAEPPPRIATLQDIRVQLFYELSSTLSPNIAPPATFSGWNTVIGEGDAKEAAQDVLVTVRLKGDGVDAILTETPLVITARNGAGKVLATRTVNGVLVPYEGTVSTALWVNNATCAGKLSIEAKMGAQVKRTQVALDCGE
jgi:hypothetical protein